MITLKTKTAKKDALNFLRNNWAQAIVVIFIIGVIHIIFSCAEAGIYNFFKTQNIVGDKDFWIFSSNKYMMLVTLGRLVFEFLLVSPIYMGAIWWYIHLVRGAKSNIVSVFVCYSNTAIFLKSIALKGITAILKLLALAPVCLCIYAQYRLINYSIQKGINNGVFILLAVCGGLFTICLICFYVLFCLRYALVDYIFVLNPDLEVMRIIKLSTIKMKHNKGKIVKIAFSFLVWIPSAILVFPLIFLVPYYAMAFTVMINDILGDGNAVKREVLFDGDLSSAT